MHTRGQSHLLAHTAMPPATPWPPHMAHPSGNGSPEQGLLGSWLSGAWSRGKDLRSKVPHRFLIPWGEDTDREGEVEPSEVGHQQQGEGLPGLRTERDRC